VSASRLRVLMIALFVAAAVFSAVAGDEPGPFLAGAVGCFSAGVLVFFRWRRALRASVFDRGEKTSHRHAE
jgi:hypothetical protein